jgi:hypothetical protein
MKRIVSLLLVITVLLSFGTVAAHADTAEVELTGQILTTVIDVDIPTTASFTINPNIPEGSEGRYIMPILEVFNATTAPVTVSIIGFDNKAETPNQFTEVNRGDKNWAELGANESNSFIYLGISGVSDQYGFLNHIDMLNEPSAYDIQQEPQVLCHIQPDHTINLNLECQSGSAFPTSITSVYELVFVASLYEKEVVPKEASIDDVSFEGSFYEWNPDPITEIVYVPDSRTVDITVVADDNVWYTISPYGLSGIRTMHMDTKIDEETSERYLTIEYEYDGQTVTKRFVFLDLLQ